MWAEYERIRPLLSAPGVVRGHTLALRGHAAVVEVRAPARFLRALMDGCDGTRSVPDLVAQMERRWGPSSFGKFVEAMLDQGVLIDASSRYLYVWGDPVADRPRVRREAQTHAQAGACRSTFASPDATLVSASQAIGLLNALSARRIGSDPAFDLPKRQIFEGCLLLAGSKPKPHETLVVARLGKDAGLRMQSGSAGNWVDVLRAMENPYEMRGAIAVAVVVANNLGSDASTWASAGSARQAFLQAGAALQRAALYAAEQAWEFHPVESFDSGRLGSLCQAPAQAVLGCAVLRAAVTPSDASQQAEAPSGIELQWVLSDEGSSQSHVVRATMAVPFDRGAVGWGMAARGLSKSAAARHAVRG